MEGNQALLFSTNSLPRLQITGDGNVNMASNANVSGILTANKVLSTGQNGFSGHIDCFSFERSNNTIGGMSLGNGGNSLRGVLLPQSGKLIRITAQMGNGLTCDTTVNLSIYINGSEALQLGNFLVETQTSAKNYIVSPPIEINGGQSLSIHINSMVSDQNILLSTGNTLIINTWVQYD